MLARNKFISRCFTFLLISALALMNLSFPAKSQAVSNVFAVSANQPESINSAVYFEENRGQFDKRARYLARGGSTTLFLTSTEAVYVLNSPGSKRQSSKFEEISKHQEQSAKSETRKSVALYMRLKNSNQTAEFFPAEELTHKTNYFKGSDSGKWITEISNYKRVLVKNIYDGVDILWQGKANGEIQYDFVVAPGVSPSQIEWQIEGAKNISLTENGELLIETEAGRLKQQAPFSYQ